MNIAGIAALVAWGWIAFGLVWLGIAATKEWISPSRYSSRDPVDLWFGGLFIFIGIAFFAAIEQIATGAIK